MAAISKSRIRMGLLSFFITHLSQPLDEVKQRAAFSNPLSGRGT